MTELNPHTEAVQISNLVSELAFLEHPDSPTKAHNFIAGIISGESLWAESARGMAQAKYGILRCSAGSATP